jgi:hypothetical protein
MASAPRHIDTQYKDSVVGEGGVAARATTTGQGNEARQWTRNNQTTKQRIRHDNEGL